MTTQIQVEGWSGDIVDLARKLRRWSVVMTHKAGASHVGSSLSMVELLAVLYGKILRFDPQVPNLDSRDRFILSKGHGCAAYYAVLAEVGFFPVDWLDTFYRDGSLLAGHATHKGVPGVEISTGSLGHGLTVATGMALVAKRDHKPWRVFCLLSDGECDEGSTWESVLFAPHNKLDNLTAIVDYNKIQSLGTVSGVMDLAPFADKWRAFGWSVHEVDGHDMDQVQSVLEGIPDISGKPTCVIAHTVKGKGVSFMEDKLLWHYRSPQGDEYKAAMDELESGI
jgi:transketolase